MRFSVNLDRRKLREVFGGGMLVMARSAATEGGMALGLCISFARCDEW